MSFDINILACPKCGGELTRSADVLTCICGSSYSINDERYLFSAVAPVDIPINQSDVRNPAHWSPWRKANFAFFKKYTSTYKDAFILDVGAGPGQFHELFTEASLLTSLDFVPYGTVSIVSNLTQRFPIKNESYTVAILSNVLEHVPDAAHVLRESYRVLKSGGVIVGAVPFLMRVHQAPFDFNRYTHYALKKLLADTGFVDISVDPLGKPQDVLSHALGHFFDYVFKKTKKYDSIVGTFIRLWVHIVRFFVMRIVHIACAIMPKPIATAEYTEGYSFSARKSITYENNSIE